MQFQGGDPSRIPKYC